MKELLYTSGVCGYLEVLGLLESQSNRGYSPVQMMGKMCGQEEFGLRIWQ